MRQIAQLGIAAGAVGLGSSRLHASEPQHCAGPPHPNTAIPWKPDTHPIAPRLAASTLGAADVARLRKAYAALRALATSQPEDPRGWLQQGNKHCWNCGGGLDNQAGEEIHGSWLFFPWHRAFLYFHERILGSLINEPSLRLAYWDWDTPAHRAVPDAWLTPHDSSNPLWDATRGAVAGNQLPTWLVGPQVINPIVNAPTFATIGGTATTAGNLENGPHGGVHIWCGDTSSHAAKADMGLLDTAAQDPLFFAHHANIDRLWDQWVHSASTHTNPTSRAWLTHAFTFWDEQKRWVSIRVADVINMSTSLRYTYGPPTPPTAPQFTEASPQALPLPGDPAHGVALPDAVRKRLTAAAGQERPPRLTTLRIDGITLPPDAAGIYRIVANSPATSGDTVVGTPNDLGYIAIVPKTSKGGHAHRSLTVELDVTTQLPQLAKESGTLHLTYVPMAETRAAKPNQLTYRSVHLVER